MKKFLPLLLLYLFPQKDFAQNGPWNDKVYRATSSDGLTWVKDTALLFFPASVPGAVKDTNGTIFIYYVYSASQFSPETLMVASSTDGKNFSAPQPINLTNNVSLKQVDPNPVLLSDGRIRLYYLDFGTLPPTNIYSAVSSDGINFTEESGIRFSQPSPGITDPDVFLVDSTWVMFVSQGQTLFRATSTDGLNFTKDVSFNWNNGGVCSTFPFAGGIFRTYYCGNGGIKSATSTDGSNLTVESGVRISPLANEIVCDPTVVELNNTYILYYKSFILTAIDENINNNKEINIFPNPFSENTTLAYSLEENSQVEIEIYNLLGEKVFTIMNEKQLKGKHQVNFSLAERGIYFLKIKTTNNFQITKLIRFN